MSAIDAFLDNPKSLIARARLWLSVTWPDVRDWFLRFVYAQHNARVIIDFEKRMSAVIHEATGYMMSKPYYDKDIMLQMIREYHSQLREQGYEDAKEELQDA